MTVELGDKVRDLITNFEGIAVARTEFINGCIQFSVVKQLKKGERIPENVIGDPSIDVKSLIIIKKRAVDLRSNEEKKEEAKPEAVRKKIKKIGGANTITKRMRGY